jgi:DNA mismatch repair protein MutS2
VKEALYRLDRYLDKAFVAGLTTVRVVHGKGTGVLREAVREALSAHPLVNGYRDGYIGEGDAGVTIVEMEERWSRP